MPYAAALGREFRQRAEAGPTRLVLPALFLLLVLPVILFAAMIVPTAEVPDEVAHIVRADSLLHGVIVGRRMPARDLGGNPIQDSGVTANPALIFAGFTFLPGMPKLLTPERLQELRAVQWAPEPTWVSAPNTAVYSPVLYVPASLGLGMGHLAGFGPYGAILAARLCNGLAFGGLGALALLLARRAQGVLFAALALPMTIALAASCNPDGILIATSCLAAALLTRATLRSWWGGAAALGVVLMAKPVYLPLALLVALAAPVRGAALRLRAIGLVLAAAPAVLWYMAAQHFAGVPFVRGDPYVAGPLWPGDPGQMFGTTDPGAQVRVFLHAPALLVRLPLELLQRDSESLGLGVIGVLGLLSVMLPWWLYKLWYAALAAVAFGASLGSPREPPGWGLGCFVLGLLAVAAAVLGVCDGQYLSWTLVGASAIEGVQGRYAIPLLPMLGLIWPRLRITGGAAIRSILLAAPVLAAAAGLLVIPRLLIASWYLR